jgi:hypothetical protein
MAGGGGVTGGGEKEEEIEADKGEEKTGKKMVSFQLRILISSSLRNEIHIYLYGMEGGHVIFNGANYWPLIRH